MDCQFLQDRIDATKAQIVLYEDAVMQLSTGAVQSYSLNTGQTTQNVSRFDINRLQTTIDSLYNRLVVLQTRLTGNGVMNMGPGW